MALQDILNTTTENHVELDAEATEEYVKAHLQDFRDLIAY